MTTLRLHDLPASARAGLSFLLLTVLGGLAAAGAHLVAHHEGRDEQPGLSLQDLEGAYHGVRATAPMISALERRHPEDLAETDHAALLRWLRGNHISEDYDNLDRGEMAPAEVIDRACVRCHARTASEGKEIGQRIPLEYWDDVRAVAFSHDIEPTAAEIVIASTHTHALTMGALSVIISVLALCSRWPRRLVGGLLFLCGLSLFCDLGSWLLARDAPALVLVIAAAGSVWMISTAILLVLAMLEMWWPTS
jgi:hypothetical protein